ncbi:MAG: short-chain fatty acid transporter [Halobacterium sp.]
MANIVRSAAEVSSSFVERYLPSAFLFAIILSFVAYAWAFVAVQPSGTYVDHAENLLRIGWYGGFWNLLSFAMQMTLILMTGYALAQTDVVDRLLAWLASSPSSEKGAAALVPVTAAVASFIHWGLGLVVGAILARKVAHEFQSIDFPIVVAGAYSGFLVWHGGLAGSIPLVMNSSADAGNFLLAQGVISQTYGTGTTIFTMANLVLVGVIAFLFLPAVYLLMYPEDDAKKTPIDPDELEDADAAPNGGDDVDAPAPTTGSMTLAERVEHSRGLAVTIGLAGLLGVVAYFANGLANGTMPWNNLNLNIVNFTFLFLGITLHGTPKAYIEAMKEAVENVWGIILQFPFYAGIMGIMSYAPEGSTSLATQIAQTLVQISPDGALPAISFLAAGLVNIFVPSGGGEWAVIGETLVTAAQESGTSIPRVAMAAAWGDAWTNMIQPFWAIPLLAISGLNVRDIMGYCVVVLLGSGLIIALGITFLPM